MLFKLKQSNLYDISSSQNRRIHDGCVRRRITQAISTRRIQRYKHVHISSIFLLFLGCLLSRLWSLLQAELPINGLDCLDEGSKNFIWTAFVSSRRKDFEVYLTEMHGLSLGYISPFLLLFILVFSLIDPEAEREIDGANRVRSQSYLTLSYIHKSDQASHRSREESRFGIPKRIRITLNRC